MSVSSPTADLSVLEETVARALATGDQAGLEILGYGEISSVLAWEVAGTKSACKRLPLFRGTQRFEAYRRSLDTYLDRLRGSGVAVVESVLYSVERPDGALAVYCVQPILPSGALLPKRMAEASTSEATELFARVLERILGCITDRLGLDAQLSNWVLRDDELSYLDVTTPMMRDARGREALDTDLFIASLPWALRGVVKRFMLSTILDKYYDPRGTVLDLLGNLFKEGLARHLPAFVARVNDAVTPAITVDEVRGYYRGDARLWALLQWLRRVDRSWQLHVRRRPYPFLIPGRIERRVG